MSGGQIEIRDGLAEGDIVVARAGALLREGDPVRPVTASADGIRADSSIASSAKFLSDGGDASLAPLAGSRERSSLLEGWGEGTLPRMVELVRAYPSPGSHLRCDPTSPRTREEVRRATTRPPSRGEECSERSLTAGVGGAAEADVFQQRGRYRGHLGAVGGAGDGDAGLVEDGFGGGRLAGSAALRHGALSRLFSSSDISTRVLAGGIIGDLARRRRGQDQRIVGRGDRGEAVREGAEAALIGVAPGGIDARRAWRRRPAPSSHRARIRC